MKAPRGPSAVRPRKIDFQNLMVWSIRDRNIKRFNVKLLKNLMHKTFFIAFLLLLLPCKGYSFFYVVDKKNQIPMNELITNNVKKGARNYVLYDNFVADNRQEALKPLIHQNTGLLVPMNEFDLNRFIDRSFRGPLDLESSLSRQIYANLKLNQLVLEYNEFKEKYDAVINEDLMDVGPAISRKSFHKISKLYSEKQAILGEYDAVAKSTQIQQNSFMNNANRISTDQQPNHKDYKNKEVAFSSENQNLKKFRNQGKMNNIAKKINGSKWDKKGGPHWFVSFILSIIKYCSKNKMEMAIYLFILLGFINILFGKQRR